MKPIINTLTSAFFSLGQKTAFVFILLLVLILSLYAVRGLYLIEVPRSGGTYKEALVGTPRYINPVLAQSQTDKDISRLVYAPLVKSDIEQQFVLAETMQVSEDNTEFVITLKDGITFHDGESITSEDVAETVRRIQDPVIASPQRPQWIGVEVETPDEKTIIFELGQAFPQFEQMLELGIMPAHVWQDIPAEEFPFTTNNIQPIGSGPYAVNNIERNDSERIVRYDLEAYRKSIFNPFIDVLQLSIVQESQDLIDMINERGVDGVSGISIESINENVIDDNTVRTYTLPRVFTLFYNRESNTSLSSLSLRKAIDQLIDKKSLVQEVLGGYGQALDGPLPSTSPYATLDDSTTTPEDRIIAARETLVSGGWTYSETENLWKQSIGGKEQISKLTLVTSETDELVRIANRIRSAGAEVGIDITVTFLPANDLIQNVIRPRDYELLLFGYVTDIPANIYPFWHSTGRTDPGLNIAEYGNIVVDRELNTLRDKLGSQTDAEVIATSYDLIQKQLKQDVPATFLFSQDLLYIQNDVIRHQTATNILEYPEDRFDTIETWYMKTERLLPFFQ